VWFNNDDDDADGDNKGSDDDDGGGAIVVKMSAKSIASVASLSFVFSVWTRLYCSRHQFDTWQTRTHGDKIHTSLSSR